MAHNINTMAYARELPWHSLGTYVGDQGVRSAEMAKAAGLDWGTLRLRPTLALDDEGMDYGIDALDHRVLIRTDTRRVLGTCKDGYEIFSNSQLFEFLDGFVSDGEARYETAGALFNGERVWALLSIADSAAEVFRADGTNDTASSYVLCVAGHDGAHAVKLLPTTVRVVCWNTLNLALSAGEDAKNQLVYSLRHTASLQDKLKRARAALTGAREQVKQFAELGAELDALRMSPREFATFAMAIALDVEGQTEYQASEAIRAELDGASERIKTRTENAVASLYNCFDRGIGNRGETRYDALNAVTEWIDHQRNRVSTARQSVEQMSRASESAWYGTGAERKAKAVRMLTRW